MRNQDKKFYAFDDYVYKAANVIEYIANRPEFNKGILNMRHKIERRRVRSVASAHRDVVQEEVLKGNKVQLPAGWGFLYVCRLRMAQAKLLIRYRRYPKMNLRKFKYDNPVAPMSYPGMPNHTDFLKFEKGKTIVTKNHLLKLSINFRFYLLRPLLRNTFLSDKLIECPQTDIYQ